MKTILLCICITVLSLSGCSRAPVQNDAEISRHISTAQAVVDDSAAVSSTVSADHNPSATAASTAPSETARPSAETAAAESTQASSEETAQEASPRKLKYIDAWDEWHTMDVDPAVKENAYDTDLFTYSDADPQQITYGGDLECLQGIDVSEHQGTIDWQAAADAGYRFAFIRVGYRGYGEAGTLHEAAEEAELALSVIRESGIETDLPLMYDPETIRDEWGRANEISREQVALNTAAFCETVESSSACKADIYSNLPWEHNFFDADTMNAHSIWYADYEPLPQTPYHFTWWQYTNEGTVPGIEGFVDLNLWLREK